MTKAEFISRVETWRKHEQRNFYITISPGLFLLIVWFTLKPKDWATVSEFRLIAWIAAPFLFGFLMALGPWLSVRYTFKRYGLSCPLCGKPLGGVSAIAIATGNCGSCGQHIIDDA